MKIDLVTKLILLSISIALWGIMLKPFIASESARASNPIIDVNIKQIDGRRAQNVLDVNIKQVNGRVFTGSLVPVEIKK